MIRKSIRATVQVAGGLTAGLAILLVFLAWRLSTGPIQLDFLNPYLEDALNPTGRQVTLRLGGTVLTWAGWRRTLDIRVLDARLVDREGTTIATVPELALSLSGQALAHGVVAPRRIEVFGPRLRAARRSDGTWSLAPDAEDERVREASIDRLLRGLRGIPDPDRPLSYLTHVDIHDADLRVIDPRDGTPWHAPRLEASVRRSGDTIDGLLSADLALGDMMARIEVSGSAAVDDGGLSADIMFHDLPAGAVARLHPRARGLAALALPLDGTVTAVGHLDGGLEAIEFEVRGGDGIIELPDPVAQRLPVTAAALRGGYLVSERRLTLAEAVLELSPGSHLRIPPAAHPLPVRRLDLAGRFWPADGRAVIARLGLDLDGPTAVLQGQANGLGGAATIEADLDLRDVPFDRLAEIWPQGLAEGARIWCVEHLSRGMITEGRMRVILDARPDGAVSVDRLSGALEGRDITVDYLPPMPEVVGVSARARFDTRRVDIDLEPVAQGDLTLRGGRVSLLDLHTDQERADITLDIEGDLAAALDLIDHEPFGFASSVGLDSRRVSGTGRSRIDLAFALLKSLRTEDIEVAAEAELFDVRMRDIVRDLDLTGGTLSLKAGNRDMEIRGEAEIGSIRAVLAWQEFFADPRPFVRRYHVQGEVDDIQRGTELGLDFAPFSGDFMRGPADAELRYTIENERDSLLQTRLDLRRMDLTLSGLGWHKASGRDGSAEADLRIRDGNLVSVPRFHVRAGDLLIEGAADFSDPEVRLGRVQFDRLVYDHTDLSGIVVPRRGGGWDANFEGESFNMAGVLDNLSRAEPNGGGATPFDVLPPITLSTNVRRLWLGADKELSRVAGAMDYDGTKWRSIRMQGKVDGDHDIRLAIRPDGDRRRLEVVSDDAGATLKLFRLYDRMEGGLLTLDGRFHDNRPHSPLEGELMIKDFRLRKAPTIARIVSYLSVTGILEALEAGEGLRFSSLEAPFLYRDGVLEVRKAKATGLSLGGTLSGNYYVHADSIDLEGTVVPAYVINSVFGKIPLLGDILTGGEEGGGVFAATYRVTGPIESPQVNVNALSALAPGILREIFGVLESDTAGGGASSDVDSLPFTRNPDN